jgi:hypothetical protein
MYGKQYPTPYENHKGLADYTTRLELRRSKRLTNS